MHKIALIAGLAAAVAASAALAQSGQPQPPPPPRPSAAAPYAQPYGGEPGGFHGRGEGFRPGWGGRFGMRHHMGPRPTLAEVQRRNAEAFALMDANKDGRVTFDEFRRDLERRRLERQQDMFRRFSGGQDSVTLDQLNARAAQRLDRDPGRGERGPGGGR